SDSARISLQYYIITYTQYSQRKIILKTTEISKQNGWF
ncbi:unnamed protein product, partial [Rotaria sordida]